MYGSLHPWGTWLLTVPSQKKICAGKRTMWSPKACDLVYSPMCINFFFLTSHPPTTMSQFQSRLDKFHTMTNAGSLLRLNARRSFRQATGQLDRLARSVPDDKDELAKNQEIWVEVFGRAMVSHPLFDDSYSRCKVRVGHLGETPMGGQQAQHRHGHRRPVCSRGRGG